ncbi:hypothetical protein BKK80_01685 [Cupriavidus malaysiensis]|uniref:DUF1579 domain-containing protein n=2 Tax=Cupriavidus malaysiensis TaxID=367825 RepID=A0ABN4TDE5_9BURK|nr:hypothetical protein BKK80_01685 [Cupriavidus malaysiensis]
MKSTSFLASLCLAAGITALSAQALAAPPAAQGTAGAGAGAMAAAAAAAEAEYVPTAQDFIGRWELTGAGLRRPPDLKSPETPEQKNGAAAWQQTTLAFYRAFDYLEIKPDGSFNFHQPGDGAAARCVWCGKWTFHDGSLWLDQGTGPRLDIFARQGDMRMSYTKETAEVSYYKWLVWSWTKLP